MPGTVPSCSCSCGETAATSQSASRGPHGGGNRPAGSDNSAPSGPLASDEALAALREELSGQS